MWGFGKKEKDKLNSQELSELKDKVRIDTNGSVHVSKATVTALGKNGIDLFDVIEQKKGERLNKLGLEENYNQRLFELPSVSEETRTIVKISIAYKAELDHEELRRHVASGLLEHLQGAFPEIENHGKMTYKSFIPSNGKESGRMGTTHITFGNYTKGIYTGIDVYHWQEHACYQVRNRLVLEISSDAQKFDKELFSEIKRYANSIATMNEAQLQNFILR